MKTINVNKVKSFLLSKSVFSAICFSAIVSICGLFLTGCGGHEAPSAQPVPVTAAPVVIKSEPLSLNFVGTVEPMENVSVKAQVSGIITRVNFSEGQEVNSGQLLFQIDPRPYKAALDAAQAQLAKDKAQAANAEIQAQRYTDLFKKELVSQEQYDSARTNAEMLKSVVQADEASVEEAKLNLEYTAIAAPISGRTGGLLVKKGNLVKNNDSILVEINQMRPIQVKFSAPGNQLPLIQHYSKRSKLEVRVRPSREENVSLIKGFLTFIDNKVDTATGTVTLKAEFPNNGNTLWPGQFVDTELILDIEPSVLTVPATAVVTGQEGTFVYVIGKDSKVEKRIVKVNRSLNNTVVLDDGLKEGELVVTDGQMRLLPGSVVDIKKNIHDKGSVK